METFWLVWSPQGGIPFFQHRTRASAEAEAERLFRMQKHKDFFVLEAISKTAFAKPVEPVEHVPLIDIPF